MFPAQTEDAENFRHSLGYCLIVGVVVENKLACVNVRESEKKTFRGLFAGFSIVSTKESLSEAKDNDDDGAWLAVLNQKQDSMY